MTQIFNNRTTFPCGSTATCSQGKPKPLNTEPRGSILIPHQWILRKSDVWYDVIFVFFLCLPIELMVVSASTTTMTSFY